MKKLLLATALIAASTISAGSNEQRLGSLMQSLDGFMQSLISQARNGTDASLKALANEVDNIQRDLQKKLDDQKGSKAENPSGDIQGLVNTLGKKMEDLLQKAKTSTDAKIKQTATSIESARKEINDIFEKINAQKGDQLKRVDSQDSKRTLKKIK